MHESHPCNGYAMPTAVFLPKAPPTIVCRVSDWLPGGAHSPLGRARREGEQKKRLCAHIQNKKSDLDLAFFFLLFHSIFHLPTRPHHRVL